MSVKFRPAPEWTVSQWLNSPPITLASLRGRIVAMYAFQMLCDGCVKLALPQAQTVRRHFPRERVTVIGLHAVFENHAAMNAEALAAFVREQGLTFPIAIDQPDLGNATGIPVTMQAYGMQGTPTVTIIDREGRLRLQRLGHVPDLELGVALGALLKEN